MTNTPQAYPAPPARPPLPSGHTLPPCYPGCLHPYPSLLQVPLSYTLPLPEYRPHAVYTSSFQH
ncbi:hypothetical protein E2C01_081919 [Portunus trituberculatus]|uniref:Uncharacterized protein n=1 Tax=Portunus trituberculatus TaxID=210409 RepID=A0A5B7INM5_PORTR|nr:hypothetical protein [Portunus trituberculatus]